jgi:hypothetical protein
MQNSYNIVFLVKDQVFSQEELRENKTGFGEFTPNPKKFQIVDKAV